MPYYSPWYITSLWTKGSISVTWWRHQMETFSALLAICAGNSPVPGEFPTQRPVTRSCDVYFDLRPNKRLSKQWWGRWFETQSWSLWRHRTDNLVVCICALYHSLCTSPVGVSIAFFNITFFIATTWYHFVVNKIKYISEVLVVCISVLYYLPSTSPVCYYARHGHRLFWYYFLQNSSGL